MVLESDSLPSSVDELSKNGCFAQIAGVSKLRPSIAIIRGIAYFMN
jgi:hypothetical protein